MENEDNVLENEDVTISKAMKDIYLSCDMDGINKVLVSNLVEFIKPFMPDHESELLELQAALDPENVNPLISSSFFYNVMTEWAKKVNEEASNSKETDFLNMTPNIEMGKFDDNQFVPYVQSTPRSSFGNRFLRGYVELNKSLQTSFLNNTQGGALDKTFYEDQINELVHQNRKGANELSRVKLQLGNAEEQNEILQAELKKINKLLTHEHEVNENLQKERTDCEDLRDASLNAKQQLDKLVRQLSSMEKENANLKQQIKDIEKEKVQCEEKNVRIIAKMEETRRSFIELQTEQNYKDKEMAQLEQINMDIMKEVDEHKKIIDDYKDTIECLQVEKNKLERMLHEKMKNSSRRHSASFSEYKNSSILIQQKSPHNTSVHHSNTSATQVPFVPAVSTDRFEFFNIDSPYARRKYHSIILDRSVPGDVKEIQTLTPTQCTNHTNSNTCKDVIPYKPFHVPKGDDEVVNSPPPIFIIGRTPPNRNNDSSSEEEFMLKLQIATNQSPHQSLQSELSQFKDQLMSDDKHDLDSSVQNDFNEQQKNELLINLLRADSDKSKKQIAEDKVKIEQLVGNNADLENKLKEFQGISDKWRELVENYNKILIEKESLQAANDTNSQKIRTLTTDLANIQNENISNYDGLVKDNEQLQIELAQLREYKTNTDNRFKELQSEIAHLTNQLESEVDQHNDSKNKLSQLENIHSMLEDDYDKLQTSFDSLLERYNADTTLHQENVNRLEKLNCEKVREIEQLQREIDVNSRKFKSEMHEVNMKLDRLHNENSSWIMRQTEADSFRKRLSETIVELESRNKNLNELLCNAVEDKQYYVKKLEDVGKHIDRSQMDMDVLEKEFTKHCHNMSFLVNENTSLRIELSDVTADRQKILEYLSCCSRELKEILSTSSYKCLDCRKEPTMFTNYDTVLSQYLESQSCVLEFHRTNFENSLTKLNGDLRSKDLEILNLRERLDMKERELVQSSKEELSEDDVRPQHSRNVDSKRNKHGRLQYKLDKLEDKVIYFQELLEKERKEKDKLSVEWKQKLANLVKDNEMKLEKDSASTNVIIFDNRHRLRRSIFNFVKKWRYVLEKIPSMEDVLDKIDNDEHVLSDRNYDRLIDKELFLLKIEVQLIINMLERLGEIDFIDLVHLLERKTVFSFSVPANCTSNSGFTLKPPTLLARPVSPDSPSVEQEISHTSLADYTLTANNDKQDFVTNNDSRQLSPDSAGGQYVDTVSNSSVSIEEINSSDDHQEVNNTIYEDAETGDRPMFALNGTGQSFENFERESLTDSELEEKFMTFVLQFTMESNTIKQRCEKQSAELNKSELEMTTLFQDFKCFLQRHLKGESLKLAEGKVEQLLVDGLHLSRSAELLGGLKQENRMLRAINLMINYVSTLRKKLDALTLKLQRYTNLHQELVSVSEFHAEVPSPSSRSDSFLQVLRRGRTLGVVSICCAVLSIVLALLFISSGILCAQPNDTITVGDLMELFLARDYSDDPPPS